LLIAVALSLPAAMIYPNVVGRVRGEGRMDEAKRLFQANAAIEFENVAEPG
jgi:hypothetical protein